MLSGVEWVSQFPTSASLDDLAEPFRAQARRFIEALRAAGAAVRIEATKRPLERAYLMHYAFQIAREQRDPASVPPHPGVEIEWAHTDLNGLPDLAASRAAAEAMAAGYGIVYRPSLESRHTEGLAIDMSIAWEGTLELAQPNGSLAAIASLPRSGAENAELHRLGALFGVFKLDSDPPHWSSDGH